jgi:RNase adaptor protein for sRNA GlmZ degradation
MATNSICTDTTDIHESGPQLRIVSFGFGHGPAPAADLVLDLREWFRDPHVAPELRQLTGRDPKVMANVLSTPGVARFVDRIFGAVAELVRLGLGTVTLAAGCAGGRHRSAVISDQLFFRARSAGWTAEVQHRDIDKPVLTSTRKTTAADAAHTK